MFENWQESLNFKVLLNVKCAKKVNLTMGCDI